MNTLKVNGIAATHWTLFIPAIGVWLITVSIDIATPPSGRVVVTIGEKTYLGTVDPDKIGKFGERCEFTIIGGARGWQTTVPAQHFKNDFGVTRGAVASATASLVGETIVVAPDEILGPDYVRREGPASLVLDGLPWYVDPSGVTLTAPRIPSPLSSEVDVLEWDPTEYIATLAGDVIVEPGTVITDTRFGVVVVRDALHKDGRIIAWCVPSLSDSEAGSRIVRAIRTIAKHVNGERTSVGYEYRVIVQGVDGRLTLQSTKFGSEVPDILQSVPMFPGLPGVTIKLLPGSIVRVDFLNADPARPIVTSFEIGKSAEEIALNYLQVKVGTITNPVVIANAAFVAWVNAVSAASMVPAPPLYTSPILKA